MKAGQVLTGRELDAIANVPGTFEFSPGAGYMPPQGGCTVTATFTPIDTKRYSPATATVFIAVQ
jgi:hypothetical protein